MTTAITLPTNDLNGNTVDYWVFDPTSMQVRPHGFKIGEVLFSIRAWGSDDWRGERVVRAEYDGQLAGLPTEPTIVRAGETFGELIRCRVYRFAHKLPNDAGRFTRAMNRFNRTNQVLRVRRKSPRLAHLRAAAFQTVGGVALTMPFVVAVSNPTDPWFIFKLVAIPLFLVGVMLSLCALVSWTQTIFGTERLKRFFARVWVWRILYGGLGLYLGSFAYRFWSEDGGFLLVLVLSFLLVDSAIPGEWAEGPIVRRLSRLWRKKQKEA